MTHDPREALEPCPFCNGEAEIHRRGDHRVSTIYRCTNCGCRLETGEEFSHGKRWNERAITASAPKAEPAADWSNLPKDIYVTGAERVDAVGFDVQCCSVPMVTAPEVRYVRADMITSPPPAAGWNEAIEAAINVVKPWPGAEGLAQSEAERAVENIRREFVKALESLRREAPAPEGVADYVPATGPIQSGDVLRYEVDEETNVGKVTAHLRPDAGGVQTEYERGFEAGRKSWGEIIEQHKAYTGELEAARPDAGGGVRLPHGYALVPTKPTPAMIEAGCEQNPTQWNEGTDLGFAADVANDVYVAMVSAAALSTPPAAVESNASVEARLREALIALDERLRSCGSLHTAEDAYDSFYQEIVSEALSAAGDEAKKSEGGVEGHASVTSTAALNETSDLSASRAESAPRDVSVPAGINPGPSDSTAERREIVARFKSVVQIMRSANKQDGLMCIWNSDIETMDAILAALDGGAGA